MLCGLRRICQWSGKDGGPAAWGVVGRGQGGEVEKGAARAQAKELRLCSKGRESQGRTSNRRAVGEDPSGLDCGEWCTEELGGEGQRAVGVAQVRNADLESGGGRGKGGVGWSRGKGGVGWEQGQRLAEGQEGPVGFWQGFPGE